MPTEEAVDPTDVTGAKWEQPTGEPQGALATALGVTNTPKTPEGETSTTQGEKSADVPVEKSAPGKPDAKDTYSAKVQELAEEAYAWAANQARQNPDFLEKLVTSGDPTDQKLATKLLARNDFGAKTIDEFKKNVILKKAGDDPRDRAIAELRMELNELKTGSGAKDWQSWKKENAVAGEAETLADQVRSEYPTMSNADVLALVRGKLGITHVPTQKEQMGYGRGGLGAVPEENSVDTESPLARALLPRDVKKTTEFAKQLFGKGRR